MNGVSIIIPAYNSEKTIAECISAAQNLDWDGVKTLKLLARRLIGNIGER